MVFSRWCYMTVKLGVAGRVVNDRLQMMFPGAFLNQALLAGHRSCGGDAVLHQRLMIPGPSVEGFL